MVGHNEERVVHSSRLTVKHRVLRPTNQPSPGGGKHHGKANWNVLLYKKIGFEIKASKVISLNHSFEHEVILCQHSLSRLAMQTRAQNELPNWALMTKMIPRV